MATDRSPDYQRGFLAPVRDFTIANQWEAESSFTQGASVAGVPSADQSGTSLVVTATGSQSGDINIKTDRSGHVIDDAAFLWKFSTDTDFYGWDVPTMVSSVETLASNGGSTFLNYKCRGAVRLPSGVVLVVSEKITATNNDIFVNKIAVDGTITNATLDQADVSTLGGQSRHPAMCVLPDDSVLCAFWVNNNKENLAQVNICRSTDEGSTWTLVSRRALPTDIDTSSTFGAGATGFDLDRLTIAANSSQVLLFAGLLNHNESQVNGNLIYQYASTSEGLKFQFIDNNDPTQTDKFFRPNIVVFNDVFIIGYIRSSDSLGFFRLQSAFESFQTKLGVYTEDTLTPDGVVCNVVTSGSQTRLEDGNLAMWIDTAGRIYLAYITSGSHNRLAGAFSDSLAKATESLGKNWTLWGQKTGATSEPHMILLEASGVANVGGIDNLAACSGLGPQMIFVQWDPNGTNNFKGSIIKLELGGYANINYPNLMQYPQDQNKAYTTLDWLPIDVPAQDSVWTKATSGSPTETITTKLALSCGNTETIDYTRAISDKTGGLLAHAITDNIVGTSATRGNGVKIQIQEKSSANTIMAEVIIKNNAIYLYDGHTSGLLASATGLSITKYDVLVFVDNSSNKATVYYAEAQNPRKYSKITGSLSTDSNTTQAVTWGIISSTGTARSADWYLFSFSEGAATGFGLSDKSVFPRPYPPQGFSIPLTGGTLISTLDGPARLDDAYTIEQEFENPIARVLYPVAPNSQVTWHSTKIATDPDSNNPPQEDIAWALDSSLLGTEDSKGLSDTIGLHLKNINFRSVEIQKYASSSWTTIATVSNDVGGSFNFTRKGNVIISTATNGTFLHMDECSGWRVFMDDGAGKTLVRKVKNNSEGVFANSTSKRAVLQIEGAKSTDPTSGTAYLIPDSVTILLHNVGDLAGIKIRITAQRTLEGYFQIGQMVLGNLIMPAGQYSRGRTIALNADVVESTDNNGVLRSRRAGRGGRVARVAWTDGVDISALYETNADPDYWKINTSGNAIAAQGSAPTTMLGLVSYLAGSTEALVYLPHIEKTANSSSVINRYHDHILCTMGNDVQIESVIGSENRPTGEGEVFRVGTVVLRETR